MKDFISNSSIIECLYDDAIIKTADNNILSSVAGGIKDYVHSLFDPDRPVASISAFLGKGLLYSMGFPWISVLYSLAEVLGFDWISFWSGVGAEIKSLTKDIIQTKTKPSEEELGQQINNIVANNFRSNFNGQIDKEKLKQLSQTTSFSNSGKTAHTSNLTDALELKKLAENNIIKNSAFSASLLKGKLSRFFIKQISWSVRVALTSLGLTAGEGAAATLLDKTKNNMGQEKQSLEPSKSMPKDFISTHKNDMSSVWIERGNIDSIQNILESWVLTAYPQLSSKISDINFQPMLDKFLSRNRLASGIGIFSVPKPYERKIDVVNAIINQ